MIIGLGNDIVNIPRIEKLLERFGDSFLTRVFTPYEQQAAEKYRLKDARRYAAFLAKRYAAKEACAKALGRGLGQIGFRDIGIVAGPYGRPQLEMSGPALVYLTSLLPAGRRAQLHVALSDDYPFAIAQVMISSYSDS